MTITLNPATADSGITLSTDNLTLVSGPGYTTYCRTNDDGYSTGMYYFEVTMTNTISYSSINCSFGLEDTVTGTKSNYVYFSTFLGSTAGSTEGLILDLCVGEVRRASTGAILISGLKTDGTAKYRPWFAPLGTINLKFNFGATTFVKNATQLIPFEAVPYDPNGIAITRSSTIWSSRSSGVTFSGNIAAGLKYNTFAKTYIAHSTGKYYFEYKQDTETGLLLGGIAKLSYALSGTNGFNSAYTLSLYAAGPNRYPGATASGITGGAISLNERVGVLVDTDAHTVQFKMSRGTSGTYAYGWTGETCVFLSGGSSTDAVHGQVFVSASDFTLGLPTGYLAWDGSGATKYLFYANGSYFTFSGSLVPQGSTPDWNTAFDGATLASLTYDNCYKDLPVPYEVVSNTTTGFSITVYPTASVITTTYPTTSVDLAGYSSVSSITIDGAEGHFALSFDKGTTWKAFKSGVWNTVTLETLDSVGMTHAEIEALTSSNISSIFQATQLDLACAVTDTEAFNGFTVTLPANQPPAISGLTVTPATTHNQDIVISYSVVDPEGSPCKSRVRLDGTILAPLFEIKSNPVSVTMQASKLAIGATKTIEVYAQDAFGASATASITVSRQNQDPTAIVTMTGNRVQATITDPDADTIRYEVRLNDEVIVPQSNLLASPVSLDFVIPTDKIILGGANTLTIYYQDSSEFKNIAATHTFTGVAYGLLFKDSVGDVLNKLDNSILKLLDIGTYYPGKGGVVKASIWNNTGYDYNGVTISLADYIAPNSIRLSFDEFKPYPQWTDSIVSTVAFPIGAEIPFWIYFEAGATSASVGVHSGKLIAEVS